MISISPGYPYLVYSVWSSGCLERLRRSGRSGRMNLVYISLGFRLFLSLYIRSYTFFLLPNARSFVFLFIFLLFIFISLSHYVSSLHTSSCLCSRSLSAFCPPTPHFYYTHFHIYIYTGTLNQYTLRASFHCIFRALPKPLYYCLLVNPNFFASISSSLIRCHSCSFPFGHDIRMTIFLTLLPSLFDVDPSLPLIILSMSSASPSLSSLFSVQHSLPACSRSFVLFSHCCVFSLRHHRHYFHIYSTLVHSSNVIVLIIIIH